jgi:hypothetical protein
MLIGSGGDTRGILAVLLDKSAKIEYDRDMAAARR